MFVVPERAPLRDSRDPRRALSIATRPPQSAAAFSVDSPQSKTSPSDPKKGAGDHDVKADHQFLADIEAALAAYADHADYSRLDRELAAAFRGHGLDLDVLDPKAAGARLAGRPSTPEVAAVIDRWCRVRKTLLKVPTWRRLLEVARAADPDPWRTGLRDQFDRLPADTLPVLQANAGNATATTKATREQPAAARDIARRRR